MEVQIKRAYAEPSDDDGIRVLVDRLWPRGLRKSEAKIDLWLQGIAPSSELRRAWHSDAHGHGDEHFAAFAESYRSELQALPASEALDRLLEIAGAVRRVTLIYGARDEKINHAVVLQEALLDRARREQRE